MGVTPLEGQYSTPINIKCGAEYWIQALPPMANELLKCRAGDTLTIRGQPFADDQYNALVEDQPKRNMMVMYELFGA